MKSMLRIAVLVLTALSSAVYAAEPAEGQAEGEIHSLDFGASSLIIQGSEFFVEPTVEVEIAGTYGAFTMLQSGMMVEFWYRRYDDGRRVIYEIREIMGREAVLL